MVKDKETIAIDLDMCLGDYATPFCEVSNREFGTNLDPRYYSEDWPTLWGVDGAEVARRTEVLNKTGMQGRLPVIKTAGVACLELAKHFDLIVATSRPKHLIPISQKWVNKNYPGLFKEVFSTGTWGSELLTKGQVLQAKGVPYLVDDQLKHAVSMSAAGGTGVLYGDYTWSQNLICGEDPIVVARTWEAVKNYFISVLRNNG